MVASSLVKQEHVVEAEARGPRAIETYSPDVEPRGGDGVDTNVKRGNCVIGDFGFRAMDEPCRT